VLPLIAATLLCSGTGLGPQARQTPAGAQTALWLEALPNGGTAVLLVNHGERPAQIDVIFARLGVASRQRTSQLTRREDWGVVHGGFAQRVEPHAKVWFRLLPAGQ
jgi:hypothetical protein